ncbi:hypothetical protein LSAT2_018280, partial [Lamellibrachia satsuma]
MAAALLTTTRIPLLFLSTAAVRERICLSVVVSVSSLLATLAFIAWADALQADVALCMCAPFYCCWVYSVMFSSIVDSHPSPPSEPTTSSEFLLFPPLNCVASQSSGWIKTCLNEQFMSDYIVRRGIERHNRSKIARVNTLATPISVANLE